MTVGKILTEVDALRENAFSRGEKLLWLSRIDKSIYDRRKLYKDAPSYEMITEDTGDDRVLLAPDELCEVYIYYLLTQIDLHNGEYVRYNNSAALYNDAFKEVTDRLRRENENAGIKNISI